MTDTRVSSDLRTRNAVPGDIPVLVEMVESIARSHPSNYNSGWIGSADGLAYVTYHIEKGWVIVAERAGEVVGHCAWSVKQGKPYQAYVRFAELQTLYVRPELRGSGAASMLLKCFIDACAGLALSVQTVHAVPDEAVLAMFARFGFVEERRFMVRMTHD